MATDSSDKKITKLLESRTKGTEFSAGMLSKLWRVILRDRDVSPSLWTRLMTNYLNDPKNNIPSEGKKRSSDRNNLNKELARPDMSWNVFYKGIMLLAPMRIKVDITLVFRTHSTTHSITRQVNTNYNGEHRNDTTKDQS